MIPYFVRSEENLADGLTKNQPEKLFTLHSSIIMSGTLMYRREDVKTAIAMRATNDRTAVYGIPGGTQSEDERQSDGKHDETMRVHDVHLIERIFDRNKNCCHNSVRKNSEANSKVIVKTLGHSRNKKRKNI